MKDQKRIVKYLVVFLVVIIGIGTIMGMSAFVGHTEVVKDCFVTRADIDLYVGGKSQTLQQPKVFTKNCGAFEITDDLFGQIEEGKKYDFVVGIGGIKEVL